MERYVQIVHPSSDKIENETLHPKELPWLTKLSRIIIPTNGVIALVADG
jgi:hypothetical protein